MIWVGKSLAEQV